MRKVDDGKRKKKKKKREKNDVFSGHYVVASSRPPERRPLERRTLAPKELMLKCDCPALLLILAPHFQPNDDLLLQPAYISY